MLKIVWNANLLVVEDDNATEGEQVVQYNGSVLFDNVLLSQKVATIVGEQLFQQMVEKSTAPVNHNSDPLLEISNDFISEEPEVLPEYIEELPKEPPKVTRGVKRRRN